MFYSGTVEASTISLYVYNDNKGLFCSIIMWMLWCIHTIEFSFLLLSFLSAHIKSFVVLFTNLT